MPTTTTGLATSYIQFTRASNATVTDSSGFIEWAGHNLLTNSESFDASAWSKSGVTVTANAIAAPNGTTTSDKTVASTTGTNAHQVTQLLSLTSGIAYTARVFMKAGEYGWGIINLYDSTTGNRYVYFNLSSGVIGTTAAGCVASISSIGNGWYLCSVTGTVANTTVVVSLEFSNADNVSDFSAVIGSCIYLWGAHLYRSDLGGMVANPARGDAYYPTTPPNLFGFTENITVAPWFEGDVTRASNVAIAPNGLQTADSITDNTATSAHLISQTQAVNAGPKTVSIYAKANTWNFIQLSFGSAVSGRANFDVTNGVAGSTDHTSSITSVGNGWYRCSVTLTTTAANLEIYVGLITSNTAARLESYAGTGVRSVYIWGAQLSDSASLDTYSPVYGAAVTSAAYYAPRLDFDPATLAAKGLLVEEQRTNTILRSAEFENAAWTPANITVTANAASSPDGGNSAELITSSGATGYIYPTNTSLLASAGGGSFTFSVYAKTGSVSSFTMLVGATGGNFSGAFDLSAVTASASGTNTTANIVSAGNGWYRCSVTMTSLANQAYAELQIGRIASSATIYLYGAQLEAGAFATSYIPTGAASATRSADVASVSTQAFPYSATEGSLVASFTPVNVAAACRAAQLDDATENERITLGTNSTPNGLMTVIDGGSSQASIATGTPAANTTMKLASRYKLDDFAVSANGAAAGTDTSGTLPTVTTLRLGSGTSSTEPLNGWLRQITYLPRALTNAELVARST